jgi:mRNA-degrading endonuclease RelE of RelBE toxin-antitoxin system
LSNYLISIDPDFFQQYDELPKDIKKKFKKQISLLRDNPKHPSLKVHKLEGSDFREFYVDDFYRCIFQQEGNIYKLYFVGTHKLIDRFR